MVLSPLLLKQRRRVDPRSNPTRTRCAVRTEKGSTFPISASIDGQIDPLSRVSCCCNGVVDLSAPSISVRPGGFSMLKRPFRRTDESNLGVSMAETACWARWVVLMLVSSSQGVV